MEFSADLQAWTATTTPPTLRTAVSDPGDYEAVSVPFLGTVPVAAGGPEQPPNFFRVEVVND